MEQIPLTFLPLPLKSRYPVALIQLALLQKQDNPTPPILTSPTSPSHPALFHFCCYPTPEPTSTRVRALLPSLVVWIDVLLLRQQKHIYTIHITNSSSSNNNKGGKTTRAYVYVLLCL